MTTIWLWEMNQQYLKNGEGRVVSCDDPIQRGDTDSETIKKTILKISEENGWKRQNFVL